MTTQTATHSDGIPIVSKSNDPGAIAINGNLKLKVLPAKFYDQFLSDAAKELQPSPIRGLFPLEKKPGVISLLAGKPNQSTFPFTSLSFTAKNPTNDGSETTINIPQDQLAPGLQYSDTAGIPDLLRWITGLQERSHGRKHGRNDGTGEEGWRVSMGSGSQDLIFKSARIILNPGDSILVESPVYASVFCFFLEVPTDADGIPKALYTVPYGCNPTGMTASTQRRKEVLRLARKHNFIILEDDPYYFLYYGKADPRPPSYFSLEATEPSGEEEGQSYAEVGRVLRFDSLSKILAAGLRIGFSTGKSNRFRYNIFAAGPEIFLAKVDTLTTSANLQVSSLTQLITYRLLQSWGYDTFLLHTQNVSNFYKEKRDIFERALQKWLGGGIPEQSEGETDEGKLAEWNTPQAGMFFWFKLLVEDPSTAAADQEGDSRALIETHAYANGVLALPGTVFLPNGSKTAYVRASFSLLSEDQVVEAIKRLRKTVLEVRRSKQEAS
ncbi:pyridoxal phosphate-dependent transferase [Rhodocollybia butyracea]|uniref:Pyridoxal phosphate-dependent transferase n=1 Tax=Rhodocollybia butyracea TaxID=206335 RepID=A0A9P5UF46_9AGAR|nr:pyridoxal phosphate-dependent transferase [Rhodocollybia butyracea]